MEITGRIARVLPMRTGVSQRTGNEWKAVPFIVEYFEHDTDRYADSVLVETFDENIIKQILPGIEVRCGISHRVREYNGRQYNEVRLYKFEAQPHHLTEPEPEPEPEAPASAQEPTAQPAVKEPDDLPF